MAVAIATQRGEVAKRPVGRVAQDVSHSAVRQLSAEIRAVEMAGRGPAAVDVVSSGCELIDADLPAGGYRCGSLVEWVGEGGGGGLTLAMTALRQAMGREKQAVLIDSRRRFYPPAAAALGVDLSRLIVLHPSNRADSLWSADQSLRCRAVAGVLMWIDNLDDINARRLQLAAERGGGLGLMLRDRSAAGQPSWAEISWQVGGVGGATHPPPGVPVYSRNYRWLHTRLLRMRAGHCPPALAAAVAAGRADYYIALESTGLRAASSLHAQRHSPLREQTLVAHSPSTAPAHESSSAMRLAAELAMPTRAVRRDRQIASRQAAG